MRKCDVLIVGTGCAGLYCALNLPRDKKIIMLTKAKVEECDSYLAQGGICVQHDENDFEPFMEDTLKAGHYENTRESVEIMISHSRDTINDLLDYGVRFCRTKNGELKYTREGGHGKHRILHHKDITGEEITSTLYARVKELDNVEIMEHTTMVDLIAIDGEAGVDVRAKRFPEGTLAAKAAAKEFLRHKTGECFGAVIRKEDGSLDAIYADCTVLATGGVGGLYRYSTNFRHLTGDGVALALRHGIATRDVDYVQIHPTTFYSDDISDRSFLISESVRGEGAKLYNKNMERFVNELIPRDKLTAAIREQMAKDGTEHVWEDMRTIPADELVSHFPNILEYCKEHGYDATKECIPVVPAQHYFMGGVKVDKNSQTSMDRLYAIGETACNGVHGKNRLASNSLLESLVFGKVAALDLVKYEPLDMDEDFESSMETKVKTKTNKEGQVVVTREFTYHTPDYSKYEDIEKWNEENHKLVLDEINRRN